MFIYYSGYYAITENRVSLKYRIVNYMRQDFIEFPFL